jgi:hypothetical protein
MALFISSNENAGSLSCHEVSALEGKIQQRYGLAKDQARKEIDDWFNRKAFNARL